VVVSMIDPRVVKAVDVTRLIRYSANLVASLAILSFISR